MQLSEYFKPGGRGVLATAGPAGIPNVALYAAPHIIDEETVVWGMGDGRSYANVRENPHAAYLYMMPGDVLSGIRLGLTLIRIEDAGEMLNAIKRDTAERVSPEAASLVKHAGYFKVVETRPLSA
ncbi:MAG: pyridoxamine 5'-phosphate oxidase family protein [Alphaproteobacteria bacterium]|uniref:Pyridoxamine 5'-phosphate oxidase family protein n=1 Tax=Candidatus Nitrobium versatile TaxID=2884831 RepID=A0A953JD57_9BACT|nr:pyridoxamine 5'-phosphate oxidase family protein [Candidatus Nitrobium versatile]